MTTPTHRKNDNAFLVPARSISLTLFAQSPNLKVRCHRLFMMLQIIHDGNMILSEKMITSFSLVDDEALVDR